MGLRFDGQVALVTGAGGGLGKAYALWLAERGAAVVVNNRVHPGIPSSAQTVVDEIISKGGKAIVDHHAVESEEGGQAMVDATFNQFGRLDILICNAGIAINTPFQELSIAKFREVVDINLWGTVLPLHAAIPRMIAAGYGRVVLTSSQAGLFGETGSTAYACTKSAMIGLARAVARDIGDQTDIRINVVTPAAYTGMSSKDLDAKWADLMSPFKVAPVVGWLSSRECQRSGMIFNVGAGRVRRAMILEGDPVELVDGEMAGCWPALDDLRNPVEAGSSFGSGMVLIPELFAAQPDIVNKR